MDGKSVPDTPENKVLNALGLRRSCCRKHMLTHVDLIDKIEFTPLLPLLPTQLEFAITI